MTWVRGQGRRQQQVHTPACVRECMHACGGHGHSHPSSRPSPCPAAHPASSSFVGACVLNVSRSNTHDHVHVHFFFRGRTCVCSTHRETQLDSAPLVPSSESESQVRNPRAVRTKTHKHKRPPNPTDVRKTQAVDCLPCSLSLYHDPHSAPKTYPDTAR